jgi:hypothetical protein
LSSSGFGLHRITFVFCSITQYSIKRVIGFFVDEIALVAYCGGDAGMALKLLQYWCERKSDSTTQAAGPQKTHSLTA